MQSRQPSTSNSDSDQAPTANKSELTLPEEKSVSSGNTASLMNLLRQRQTSAPDQKTPVLEARSSNANSPVSRRPSRLDILSVLSESFGRFNTFIIPSPTAPSTPVPQDETRNTNNNGFRDMCRPF